ncbi:MAG: hypothetical protein NTX50_21575 [Candidatus Sumerlaeota bacterium]|nr:hypothetical protein [Candidatus Sumerlaeota bacterium]
MRRSAVILLSLIVASGFAALLHSCSRTNRDLSGMETVWVAPRAKGTLSNIVDMNETVFFVADEIKKKGAPAEEFTRKGWLWKIGAQARRVKKVTRVASNYSNQYGAPFLYFLTSLNGSLFFSATDKYGDGLWRSDGTESGTRRIKSIPFPGYLTKVNDQFFFASGNTLWKCDGVSDRATIVKSFPDGRNKPYALTNAGGACFFLKEGRELWKSDGTEPGTTMAAALAPICFSRLLCTGMAACGRSIYYFTLTPASKTNLWRSDGSSSGTVLLKSNWPEQGLDANDCAASGESLYFFANDGVHGRELWKSNGSLDGTLLVKDIFAGTSGSIAAALRAAIVTLDGIAYFSADDGLHGQELWRSDGTPDGTRMVKDLCPGSIGSRPSLFAAAKERLYFVAGDGVAAPGVWESDGTPENTRRLCPPRSDFAIFDLYPLTISGPRVYCVGIDAATSSQIAILAAPLLSSGR